jgi:hypothetical protein
MDKEHSGMFTATVMKENG